MRHGAEACAASAVDAGQLQLDARITDDKRCSWRFGCSHARARLDSHAYLKCDFEACLPQGRVRGGTVPPCTNTIVCMIASTHYVHLHEQPQARCIWLAGPTIDGHARAQCDHCSISPQALCTAALCGSTYPQPHALVCLSCATLPKHVRILATSSLSRHAPTVRRALVCLVKSCVAESHPLQHCSVCINTKPCAL